MQEKPNAPKNVLLFDLNNVLEDVEKRLIELGHTILPLDGKKSTWKKADVIVVWQETELGGWRETIEMWQRAKKRVVLVQHGRRGVSRIYHPFNEELISDQLCVWGENDVKRMTECGVPRERVFLTGTPIVKHVLPKIPHEGINIVFAPEHWEKEVAENFIVRNALRKFVKSRWPWQKKVKIISKILKGEHDPHNYDNSVVSNRLQPGHLDVAVETLRRADAVVAISESTFELLAEIMDVPVIIADIWVPKACGGDPRYKDFKHQFSPACERVKDMNQLGKVIMKHVSNPQLLRKERAEIGILDGGTDISDPIENIVNVILNEKIS